MANAVSVVGPRSVTVYVRGDTVKEPDETFYVQLSGASGNAWLSNEWALGYIYNDDAKPGHRGGKNR